MKKPPRIDTVFKELAVIENKRTKRIDVTGKSVSQVMAILDEKFDMNPRIEHIGGRTYVVYREKKII